MNSSLLALRQLNRQLLSLRANHDYQIPKEGWVRTFRKTLGMTIRQLARRLGVNPSRVVKIETSEIAGSVTLRTLQAIADIFDCRLVYSFVPNKDLEEILAKQADQIARKQMKRIAHTMDLEAQSLDPDWLEEQIKELSEELLRKSWKHLWEEE
ncbi:MAG: mobile mystery protein A [Gammaproteobacteria bacterium]